MDWIGCVWFRSKMSNYEFANFFVCSSVATVVVVVYVVAV